MRPEGIELCRASIAHHSKSFALASRLLPGRTADEAAIVYAWCRRADDAIDGVSSDAQPAALARLRAELASIYAGARPSDPELQAFQAVVEVRRIPREYPEELLAGMQMDCERDRYATLDELLAYCFRVAGTVGLMMCHVMGVRDREALRHAAHLGIAMQITNICRDVREDWEMRRLYLPEDMLAASGAGGLAVRLGQPFPDAARAPVARVVARLLTEADHYYRSGDVGLQALSWRCALAVRAARRIYAAIGARVRRQGCDVTVGRAFVSARGKLWLVAGATLAALVDAPRCIVRRFESTVLDGGAVVRFPEDVLPLRPVSP